jgi:hypothetical protein
MATTETRSEAPHRRGLLAPEPIAGLSAVVTGGSRG